MLRVGGRRIPLDEITYLEISGQKTVIHTKEEWIEHAIPLSKLKEGFQQEGFCLSHFSYLVNLCHVTRVERNAFQMDDLQSPTVLIATVTLPHTLSVEAMIGQVDFLLWMAR